jgi:hypothetical protein
LGVDKKVVGVFFRAPTAAPTAGAARKFKSLLNLLLKKILAKIVVIKLPHTK